MTDVAISALRQAAKCLSEASEQLCKKGDVAAGYRAMTAAHSAMTAALEIALRSASDSEAYTTYQEYLNRLHRDRA